MLGRKGENRPVHYGWMKKWNALSLHEEVEWIKVQKGGKSFAKYGVHIDCLQCYCVLYLAREDV